MADRSIDAGREGQGESAREGGSAAELHELDVAAEVLGPHLSAPDERAAWERVLAGLWLERGAVQEALLERWRRAVLEDAFDAGRCSQEILAARDPSADSGWIPERTGRLLRDFLMSEAMRATTRRARVAAKRGLAFVVAQIAVLALFCLVGFLFLIVLRLKGVSLDVGLDRLLERILSWLPA